MKKLVCKAVFGLSFLLIPPLALAATPQEQAFMDSYRKALEANDTKTLESFVYTKDADPEQLAEIKDSLSLEEGMKVSKIELADVSTQEVAQAMTPREAPDGTVSAFTIKPTKKLIVTLGATDGSDFSLSSQRAVGEVDGKLLILVPSVIKR